MKWFKMDEFRCKCCGQVGEPERIEALVDEVLDPARERYGGKVKVSSGYRCRKHNAECAGASKTSQHMRSEASDLIAGSPAENLKLAKAIVAGGKWDQMILYVTSAGSLEPRFVHVSYKKDGGNRKQILKQVRGMSGYQRVEQKELEKA